MPVTSSLLEQLQRALGDAHLLERELGGGGMSRVFLAQERALGRKVVVKVLLPELAAGVNVERFRREIQLAAQLQHPHIVPLLSAGEADGLPYFIMPFVSGESLRTRIAREGEFPVSDTLRVLRDVVSALGYAHSTGIVHRDVKPENVLLSGGVAVVTDFGVAKAVSVSAGSGSTGLTSMGVALGTPTYMAPEQATASPLTDHRADIYALGVVAYEMLTGSPPFSGRSAQAMLAAHVVEEPEPVERRRPSVPPMLAGLVKACLAKRPAERPQSAAELMQVLDAITTPSGGTAATTAVRLAPAGQMKGSGRRRLLIAGVAGLALLAGGIALWSSRSPSARPNRSPPAQSANGAPAPDSVGTKPPQPVIPTPPPAADPVKPVERRTPRSSRPPRPAPIAPVAADSSVALKTIAPAETLPEQSSLAPEPPAPRIDTLQPSAQPAERGESILSPPSRPVAAPAPASDQDVDPRPEIQGLLGEYARAIGSKNLADLRRIYPGMTQPQQQGWEQFFQLVRDVRAELTAQRLNIAGEAADAQVTGTYVYLNTSTGRQERQPVSFRASFKRQGGVWRIIQVR